MRALHGAQEFERPLHVSRATQLIVRGVLRLSPTPTLTRTLTRTLTLTLTVTLTLSLSLSLTLTLSLLEVRACVRAWREVAARRRRESGAVHARRWGALRCCWAAWACEMLLWRQRRMLGGTGRLRYSGDVGEIWGDQRRMLGG